MPRCILMIGPPAVGKSTKCQELTNFRILSADLIREGLYGDANIQGDPKEVFQILYTRLEDYAEFGMDMVIDNTNLKKIFRERIVNHLTRDYEIEYWIFKVPIEVALERNLKRARRVPEEVIKRMYDKWEKLASCELLNASVVKEIDSEGKETFVKVKAKMDIGEHV